MAVDPELGPKVKVTILATGFGIENVDGINERMAKRSQEEEQAKAQEEEEKDKRREGYYGTDTPTTKRKQHANIYFFRPEDLDNEDVIIAVEESPTYSRSQQRLEDIRKRSVSEPEEDDEEPEETLQEGTISFTEP